MTKEEIQRWLEHHRYIRENIIPDKRYVVLSDGVDINRTDYRIIRALVKIGNDSESF